MIKGQSRIKRIHRICRIEEGKGKLSIPLAVIRTIEAAYWH